jgi:hypothetical protein
VQPEDRVPNASAPSRPHTPRRAATESRRNPVDDFGTVTSAKLGPYPAAWATPRGFDDTAGLLMEVSRAFSGQERTHSDEVGGQDLEAFI